MEQNNALARKFNAASLLRFALPNIAMMMLLSMYTIVDGMFISRFAGTTALSAINMSFPLNCLQMATGIMLGTGGSAIIARRQGEGRTDEARRNFTMLIAVALGIGLIFAVFGNLFLNPILRLLGTSELQWADCRIYTRIQLVFAPMLFLQTAFQTLFVTAGKPGLGLLTSVGGGITNAVSYTHLDVYKRQVDNLYAEENQGNHADDRRCRHKLDGRFTQAFNKMCIRDRACGIESGSAVPNKTKVAKLSKADCQKIAETKMPDLNAASLEAAMSMIAGTARSMGITVEE